MITISDTRLIEQCKKGKARYQKLLYDKFACKVYPVCYRYAKNEEDAKDILQETFIRVYSKLETFQNKGSFEGWIRKIAVNTSIRHYQQSLRKIDQHDIECAPELATDETILSEMNAADILKKISELPTGYRVVFNLFAIEGYSHKEIAQELGISEGSSRSQLTRARQSLIQAIQPTEKQYVERA
ncbi:MAG: RNA polymerase sigma factor [Crocinitomicaceae bacterium]|nr:RNA polymerase sigma factor [Flavobacteriales bacterium]NQZ34486.1 RNA polymerase sigma factor [Crocinitomicaceae bacterium]